MRFDVYLHDDKGRIINVEMQIADRGNLAKRTRAYHSIIDLDAMDRSRKAIYANMPEVIVIFICAFDPFKLGRCVYTFKSVCIEERDLLMNDGASTVFLNTKGQDEEVSPRLRAFLRYLEGENSDDDFVKRLEERLKFARQNKHSRQEYLLAKFERGENIEEGIREGLQQGIQQEKLQTANRMRNAGMTDEQINLATGLSLEEISKL